jgi:hypothetical protein
MLSAFPGTYLSAHTAYSATGGSEVTGGSPAYARKAVSYATATGEARAATNTPTFDVPASTTVRFIGMWDAPTGGNFLGMIPNGGDEKEFGVDLVAGAIKIVAHGLVATTKVAFVGDTPPAPLTEGVVYFVAGSVTANAFQVSATSGGATISLSSEPGAKCVLASIVEESFGSQGTLAVFPHTVRLNA